MKNKNKVFQQLRESLKKLEMDKTLALTKQALENKVSAQDILMRGLVKGLDDIGKLYESGKYFLTELAASAAITRECMKILRPKLTEGGSFEVKGKIVIGTVSGDIHDIGKNLVKALALASGFEVYDLGIDVPEEKFVKAVKQKSPDILAMSALLSTTRPSMETVVKALKKAGLRNKVYIVMGGRIVTEDYAKKFGGYYAEDAFKAVELFKKLVKKGG